jgi:uncharacterized zinc-type alcohol dehydrogenase-like protein
LEILPPWAASSIHAGRVIIARKDWSSIALAGPLERTTLVQKMEHQRMEDIPTPLWYSPLRYWKVGKGHKLAVLGLGGLGHMGVKFGVAFGAEVTVLSTSASKEADAKKLGAHKFMLTSDPKQIKNAKGSFDFILDTVSAPHELKPYLSLLKTNGTHIMVGIPSEPSQVPTFSLMDGRKSLAASGIGGLPETQEMLDYCAEHNIVCDIEMIDIKDIHKAYDRMLKGDVRYRFVIDMATL